MPFFDVFSVILAGTISCLTPVNDCTVAAVDVKALPSVAASHPAPAKAPLVAASDRWRFEEDKAFPAAGAAAAAARRESSRSKHNQARSQERPSDVFQSVAVPFGSLPSAKKWHAVLPEIERSDLGRCNPAASCSTAKARLANAIGKAEGSSFVKKLSMINGEVNRSVSYTTDQANYGTLDYWAAPETILARGKGDCEDYAILKMAALLKAGVPSSSMSIVVVQDQRRNLFHAVLSVATNKGHYILDNLRDEVAIDTSLEHYLPLYSMSGQRSWIHGSKRRDSLIARLPAHLAPGEGIEAFPSSLAEPPAAGF